jgi:hypothetical protein
MTKTPRATQTLLFGWLKRRWRSDVWQELPRLVRRMNRREIVSLERRCVRGLESGNNDDRHVGAHVLCEMFPRSARAIDRVLHANGSREAQWQLFFEFDLKVGIRDCTRAFRKSCSWWVTTYLRDIDRDSAHAAHMAGDFIARNFSMTAAIGSLLTLMRDARFAAGRRGAVLGCEHLLPRLRSLRDRKRVLTALRYAANHDRSEHVRACARLMLFTFSQRGVYELASPPVSHRVLVPHALNGGTCRGRPGAQYWGRGAAWGVSGGRVRRLNKTPRR